MSGPRGRLTFAEVCVGAMVATVCFFVVCLGIRLLG